MSIRIKIKQLRSKLLELLTQKMVIPFIFKFRNKHKFSYSMNDLLLMPANSIGNDLAIYLQKRNFELISNYVQHDFKHIALNYEMDELGEARMQFYFLGNRHYSFTVLITISICFLLMPEYWKQFYKDYKRGNRNPSMKNIDFAQMIYLPTEQIKKQFI